MFRELVELGGDFENKGVLPPAGFYDYREPIKWVVHLWPDRVYVEAAELARPRPYSGRTSDVQAHLLVDEAGYALGVTKDKTGAGDRRAPEKHKAFRALLQKFLAWKDLKDPALREVLNWLKTAFDADLPKRDTRYGEILNKDWVSFVPETGALAGQHLFEHPDTKALWIIEMQERSAPGEKSSKHVVVGQCSVCGGKDVPLVGKIPLGVKLAGVVPIHSFNQNAFPSFQSGSDAHKTAHLGLCFRCGDTASRAFNYLSSSEQHRRRIVRDKEKRDSLANQTALFWLKVPAPVQVGETVLDLGDLDAVDWGAALEEAPARNEAAQATTSQLLELLKLPWTPTDSALGLDDYGFYLGVLSPNVGRIALRDWIAVSLVTFKEHLKDFLVATLMVSPSEDSVRPQPIAALLEALENKGPNLTRGLLRTAYTGVKAPTNLHIVAAERFARLVVNEASLRERNRASRKRIWDDNWPHALAAVIKLGLYYGTKEVETMAELNPEHRNQPYLCGRLLAVLEEAQLRASNFSLNKTLVDRFYGSASTAPASVFGSLVRLATTAHLPELGKEVNLLMEEVMSRLDEAGGFPKILTLAEQAEFALGFYHQRSAFRSKRGKTKSEGGQQ